MLRKDQPEPPIKNILHPRDARINLKKAFTTDKKLILQLSSYLAASILGTAAHYFILICLVQYLSLSTLIASTTGALVGALVIYNLNYFLVFKSTKHHRNALTQFSLVTCLGVALNAMILKILISIFNWHYLILQIITTVIIFCCNFALNRSWTFASKTTKQNSSIGEEPKKYASPL